MSPCAVLQLKNPRLERVEDVIHTLYLRLSQPHIRVGFRLTGYRGQHEFFCKDIATLEEWMSKLRRVSVAGNFSRQYKLGKLLGKGCFAKVHIAKRIADGATFAVKTIEKSKAMLHSRGLESVASEVAALRALDHPNVIKLFEVYENSVYVHLILEYMEGGELFKYLKGCGRYTEKDASLAVGHVLEGLKHCHERNIVHRDLKPENLMLMYHNSALFITVAGPQTTTT